MEQDIEKLKEEMNSLTRKKTLLNENYKKLVQVIGNSNKRKGLSIPQGDIFTPITPDSQEDVVFPQVEEEILPKNPISPKFRVEKETPKEKEKPKPQKQVESVEYKRSKSFPLPNPTFLSQIEDKKISPDKKKQNFDYSYESKEAQKKRKKSIDETPKKKDKKMNPIIIINDEKKKKHSNKEIDLTQEKVVAPSPQKSQEVAKRTVPILKPTVEIVPQKIEVKKEK